MLRYPTTDGDAAPSASTSALTSGQQGPEDLRLLEISNELAKEIEQDMKAQNTSEGNGCQKFRLTIKGKPSDDAVICTQDRTFQLRSISVSNSLLLFQQRKRRDTDEDVSTEETTLELKSTVREIMELLPMVPKLDRIETLLKGSAWQGMASEAEKQREEMATPTVSMSSFSLAESSMNIR